MAPASSDVQRRSLVVLVVAQVLSGVGMAAGATVGSLIAQDVLGSVGLAGLPSALGTAGSVFGAVAVGRISHTRGRRPGLAAGFVAGALGSAGVVVAAVVASPALLFGALFVYGVGMAATLQARYAGADLAAPGRRARAVSIVLVATAAGAVAGANLAAPSGELAHNLGIPRLAGLFLLAAAAYAAAALVLVVWLRPDPLLLSRALDEGPAASSPHRSGPAGQRRDLLIGTLVMLLAQLVMVAIMTMTPIHMLGHGHDAASSGLVIAIHLGAMYLPSPLTGWLVDRFNRSAVAAAAGATLLAAGVVAGTSDQSVVALAVALGLLGLGWNLGLVTGTAMITDAATPADRAKAQGLGDVVIAIAGATGGMASGLVVAAAGFAALAIGGGLLAMTIVPVVVAGALATAARRRRAE